jgi:RNA polymerase sigma-70 factor (ECF subfamily)
VDDFLRLYERSGAARWSVSPEAFGETIARCLASRVPSAADARERTRLAGTLHLEDLALAAGCLAGDDAAWEHVVRELRPALYQAARTIAGDDGRELADSLFADLYGLTGTDGSRRSLLAYYHGRSRLTTWLRSVLVQRRIDHVRAGRRLRPLEDAGIEPAAPAEQAAADPDRDRLVRMTQEALDAAIDALAPADRLRLRLYYGQGCTLRDIGRLTGEHEATVSRKLEKTRRAIRAAVESSLAARGLGPERVRLCFEYAGAAPEMQLDRLLTDADGARSAT